MLGPFDRRRKRSRCQRCAASHLKCSGTNPCANCSRKDTPCIYATAASTDMPIIIVESGKAVVSLATARRRSVAVPGASPALDDERYFYYFDVFARRNSFSGKKHSFTDDVKQMGELQTVPYFLNSIRALGAIQASKLAPSCNTRLRSDTCTSYALYAQAVTGLRKSLDRQKQGLSDTNRTALLWTTLFLGMFEVRCGDAPSRLQTNPGAAHVGHERNGVAAAHGARHQQGPGCVGPVHLRRAGWGAHVSAGQDVRGVPDNCLQRPVTPDAARMDHGLAEVVVRRPLLGRLATAGRAGGPDAAVFRSTIQRRANLFCLAEDANPSTGVPEKAREIAGTGMALRAALTAWHKAYLEAIEDGGTVDGRAHEDECGLLTRLFWSGISIYLSGTFDYEMYHWRRFGLAVPSLDAVTVRGHVETILLLVEHALDRSSLSPLLFLFPLRIAGARSTRAPAAQRARVLRILDAVAERFAAGQAIKEALIDAWVSMGVGTTDDSEVHEMMCSKG
ncbi:C6 finger domain protein [Beauveria brongniartii RCEF 3172]|uniref:C6 finger domain protein n=1 Tax=Beauveria brongniartii RCEF 3172 TaxID=1081107 RepID=A0A166X364_9HYPO|nr:C6 finger domain protein [Beauveria brongniartii RCEF 3172]